ncbi:MAG: LPXTG cell wall anchor domain-containing protein [Prolixibacteraceae bacterium]|jgi:LPXTG-motif cell wall-anchored protein|nr:LPXTG cell wall anchor domain-containing protein [Prolixibacteraceae bacterium]
MKKSIIRLALAFVMMLNIAGVALAQQAKAQKDTVNADKAAKPVFYDAAEEETKSGSNTAIYIAVGVVVAAGVVFMLRKKKK